MAEIWKGAPVSASLTDELITRANTLKSRGVVPCLAILRVGERADDLAYERGALKRCEKIGVDARQFTLPADTTQKALMATITEINDDEKIHGCLRGFNSITSYSVKL